MEHSAAVPCVGKDLIAVPAGSTDPHGVLSDKALIEACLTGSEDAWSALIDKYRKLIFSVPIRQGFSQEDSREIFQQVCLIMLSELPGLREHIALTAWLIRVTANECSRWRRKESRHTGSGRSLNQTPATPSAEMEDLLCDLE